MKMTINITDDLINNYAVVSNDMNPIHFDKKAAIQAGFSDKVAHGMLSMSIAARFVSPLQQDGWIVTLYNVKFSAPLFVHNTLVLNAETKHEDNTSIVIQLRGRNEHNRRVIHGKIKLRSTEK